MFTDCKLNEAIRIEESAMNAEQLTDKSKTILLVEDDRLVLVTVAKGLRNAGYTVLEAASAEEALAVCEHSRPDMAICDIRMPGMSGIEAAKRLAETYDTPFMIFSAYGDNDLVSEAIEHGALGYLIKPLDVTQLIPAIETALSRASDIRQLHDAEFHLNRALNSGRETSTAIGILMERFHCTSDKAFELLREHARANRRKVADVAGELLGSMNKVNMLGK